jgi:uncharacterized protein
MNIWILALIIMAIAIFMTMTGHGGGNFFVIALALSNINMHTAAATGQFILFTSGFFAMLVFGRKKFVEWRLAVLIGSLIGISAFAGGLFSDYITARMLKLVLTFFLFFVALIMLRPNKKQPQIQVLKTGWMYWNVQSVDKINIFPLNLILIVPFILVFGFIAGMVGISGGSFIVPLLVLSCNVPVKSAIGTASTMVTVSAITGFAGHAISRHFDSHIAIPVAIGGALGGLIGGSLAIKTKSELLKILFAVTTLIASLIMGYKTFF